MLSLASLKAYCQSDSVSNKDIDYVVSIVKQVEDAENFVDQLSPSQKADLPFGIRKQIGAVRYSIAIDSMKFLPSGAYFSAYAGIDFPGTSKKICFKGSNIKFNPSGVIGGNQAKLYLASDHSIKISNSVTLKLSKNNQNYVVWDCNGFKAINLSGEFIFKDSLLIPDTISNPSSKVVKASFQIYTTDIHNFITQVNISPFMISGLKDWSFSVNKAIVDYSELANSPDMVFPAGYYNPNLITPVMWSGFFLKEFTVKLPKEISRTGTRTTLAATNLMIENIGVSGLFSISNSGGLVNGSMSGWDFSLNELGLGFVCNKLNSGYMKGSLNIPIQDSTEKLNYNAGVYYNPNTKETDYNFTINPANNLNFKVFSARVNLNNNSSVSVIKSNGYLKPIAVLNGNIIFLNPKFNSNGAQLAFQNVTIKTDAPYLTNGLFALTTTNGAGAKTGNYGLSINNISCGVQEGQPVLGFSVTLNLTNSEENSLSAGTMLLLKGKIDPYQRVYNGDAPITFQNTRWKFDKVLIGGLSINVETSPFLLRGTVLFRRDDPIYGDGFAGKLEFQLKKIMNSPVEASVVFGSLPAYKYFYTDIKVPTSIPLTPCPITLNKLIGGLYYHMKPGKNSTQDFIDLKNNFPSATGNALTYTPSDSINLGFKTGVGYKYTGNEVPFNGDMMLEANFTSSGGLGKINLSGDLYSLATINNRGKAPVKGKIVMEYDAPNSTFDALAQVIINAKDVITGTGYIKVHFDKDIWYVHAGKPSLPNSINFANLVYVPFYFMVGNQIEPASPLPTQILESVSGVSSIYGSRNISQLSTAGGFCAGARLTSAIDRSFGFSFFNVRGYFDFDLGFDMMMQNYGENSKCEGTETRIGMNGWLAEGNMYLAMRGGVDINGHFKFPSGCPSSYEVCLLGVCTNVNIPCLFDEDFSFNVFNASIGAIIQAKVPKPIYFSGLIYCNYSIFGKINGGFNYDFKYGENCVPVIN